MGSVSSNHVGSLDYCKLKHLSYANVALDYLNARYNIMRSAGGYFGSGGLSSSKKVDTLGGCVFALVEVFERSQEEASEKY